MFCKFFYGFKGGGFSKPQDYPGACERAGSPKISKAK